MNAFRHRAAVPAALFALAATALGLPQVAAAQAPYPSQAIRLVVGFAPSGGTDTTARIVSKKLAEQLGQQIVIDNRPGAGGNIATELVARAPADGYTIMLGSVGPLTVSQHVQKVGFDATRDFAPLTMAVEFGNVIVVHPGVKAERLAEYLQLATDPVKGMPYGTSGVATIGHLAGELLASLAKVNLIHVPYKGGGPATADLMGGQIPSMVASAPSVVPQIRAGKLRAIAVTSLRRSPFMPDVPTVAESGYPGYEAVNWYGFIAPAKVPREIVDRLSREIQATLKAPEIVEQLGKHGMEVVPSSPDEMAARIRRETELWLRVVKTSGIRLD